MRKYWKVFFPGLVLMYIGFGLISSRTSYMILPKRDNTWWDRGERGEMIENQVETHDAHNEKMDTMPHLMKQSNTKATSGMGTDTWPEKSQLPVAFYLTLGKDHLVFFIQAFCQSFGKYEHIFYSTHH